MDNKFLFRGKKINSGEWITGAYAYCHIDNTYFITHMGKDDISYIGWHRRVDPTTVGQCTGLFAKKSYRGKRPEDLLIFKGDITELKLPNGEKRRFEVDIRTVIRKVVNHPDFDESTAKVAITGVVFLWNGYELFPCVDEDNKFDTAKMKIIGNIYDTPDLL